MDHEIEQVVGAFIDGEHVDPEALKRALADADGRNYLIDLLALREAVWDMAPLEPAAAVRATPSLGGAAFWRLASAAAVVLIVGAGSYFVGQRAGASDSARPSGPSRPGQVVQTVMTVSAPAPTRVIRLEPGVNWTDGGGGQ